MSGDPLHDPQQILNAFDKHFDQFKSRLRKVQGQIEIEAYRQLIETLTHQLNSERQVNAKLEHVFKSLDIDPREQKAWAEKLPEGNV
jgi:hypothetical protein